MLIQAGSQSQLKSPGFETPVSFSFQLTKYQKQSRTFNHAYSTDLSRR